LIAINVCFASVAIATATHGASSVCLTIMIALAIFDIVLVCLLIRFANKNPQAVILEGAEFLVHEQIQLAAKGITAVSSIPLIEEIFDTTDTESQLSVNQLDKSNKVEEEDNDG
jgi:hypothetical protein